MRALLYEYLKLLVHRQRSNVHQIILMADANNPDNDVALLHNLEFVSDPADLVCAGVFQHLRELDSSVTHVNAEILIIMEM